MCLISHVRRVSYFAYVSDRLAHVNIAGCRYEVRKGVA